MSQTLSPAHAKGSGFKLGQGLVLAAVMGGSRTAPEPAPAAGDFPLQEPAPTL